MQDAWADDPDDPALVAAWHTVATSEDLGRPGLAVARAMHPTDLVRSVLYVEARRGMDRRAAAERQALAALRAAKRR